MYCSLRWLLMSSYTLTIILLLSLVTMPPTTALKHKNLTIGTIFPMTGGWAGGKACLPAVKMALDDINKRHDVLPDYNLEMDYKDSQCMPGLGTKVLYELLYNPPTKILVLTGCSIVSTFVAEAAKMWNLVVLAYGASSPALSNRDRFPTFFRTHPSATLHNPTRVKLFQRYKWKRIATIQVSLEVFTSTIDDLERKVKEANIDIAVRQSFLTDPTNAVKNLKRQDARIIVGVFYEDMARRVFCQAYKEKLYGKKYVWFIIGWYPDNWYMAEDKSINCTVDQLKEALEGHFTTEAMILNQQPTKTLANMTSQRYKERLDSKLNVSDTSQVTGYPESPLAYDALWAVALALNKTAARLALKNLTLDEFDYNKKHITDEIYSAMDSTSFLGVSGNVAFSSEGDRIALTQIEQMINGTYHLMGYYDSVTDNLTWLDKEQWLGGKPPPDHTRFVRFLRVVPQGLFFSMSVLAFFGILAGIVCMSFNIMHKHRRLIIYSHAGVNNVMVVGCQMCLFCIFLIGMDGQFISEDIYPVVCQIRAWLLTIGFTLGYGSMFSKIWTVHRLATTRKKERKVVRKWELLAVLVCLLVIDMAILVPWQLLDPLYRHLEKFPPEEPKHTSEDIMLEPYLEHCSSKNMKIWLGIMFSYKGVLLIFGLFLAYETRSVKLKQVNDSRFVGMSIYNVVVLCVITAPITLIINSQQDATFAFMSLAIVMCSFLSMGLIFGPKIVDVLNNPHQEGMEIRALTDSLASREEEERYQRLLAENEEIKKAIAQKEDRLKDLNERVKKAQQQMLTMKKENYVSPPLTDATNNSIACTAPMKPLNNINLPLQNLNTNNMSSLQSKPDLTSANIQNGQKSGQIIVDLNTDSGLTSVPNSVLTNSPNNKTKASELDPFC
ncbi:gamma-aminobutyric acid type B receptor subunit 1-like [Octopus vulgaris]|uniref:Gamma-aminobutyric acid type B receptor subunit 1-like n=2 Tax=Octopus TaxID=6643 RepID=A0AA36BQS7_OCTVU|nr:gamma-aminobutyric acid type B receptor subunit 1-like [Octopus sinensis]CAI9738858.1 gamma-aminobutyric acid type B receptor subunit 1-like [Octopus vulgaris]